MSSNQPHSKPTKRRCLYEILDVARTATESEIRAAYKIQAKKWHPDRNYGNAEEAEHMFKEINAAYEVLMDKNERAWYNAHREHILRGEKANENTNDMDLVPYFSVWAFSGFDVNDDNNFYSVYSKLFDEIVELEGLSKKKTPQFGTFNTKWNKIDRFYNYWENFHCRRKFDWKSVYNLNSAQNRYIRKQMEKENKKIISQAKREWEDTVIKLVLFIKKRDPRYRNHLVEMEQERLKQEQIEKEREYEEQLLLKEERRKEKEIEYEKILKEIENDEKFNESMFIEHEFQCIVCNKTFKSEKSFKNHERSKKHLKALERLKQELSLEDELFMQNDNINNNNNNNNNDINNNDDNVDNDDDNDDNNEGNIENENENENESNNENENENENYKEIIENLAKSKDHASDIDFLLASQMQAQFDKVNIGNNEDSNNESGDDDNDDNDENAQTIVKNILENIINEIVNECDSNNNNNNNKTNSSINAKTVDTTIENTGNDTNVTNENKNDNSNENESDTDSEEAKMKEFLNSFKKGKNNQNKASLSKQNLKANKKDKKKRRRRKDKNDDNNNDSEMIENLEKLNDSQSILREYHKQNALNNKKKGKNSSNSSINSKNKNDSAQRSYCRACNRPFPSKSKLFKHLKEFPQHSLVSNAGAFSKDNKVAN